MKKQTPWRRYWQSRGEAPGSDFWADRGRSQIDTAFERKVEEELMDFVGADKRHAVLDAGCGTGRNVSLLSRSAGHVVGMDYSEGMAKRAQIRIKQDGCPATATIVVGSISAVAFKEETFDRILCVSVMQYLSEEEAISALKEFYRISKVGATVILHIKNFASLYISTLVLAKKLKQLLGGKAKFEYYRTFRWYEKQAAAAGFESADYHSHNIFLVDFLPRRVYYWLSRFEREHYRGKLFRRFGADYFLRLKRTSEGALSCDDHRERG